MKILHVGLSAEKDKPNGLQYAFKQMHECREIGFSHPDIDREIINELISFMPDMIWMQLQTSNIVSHDTVDLAREAGVFVMNWMGDIRPEFPEWIARMGVHANLTCFSNMNDVDRLNSLGIRSDYLQIGYDHHIYTPHGDLDKRSEIVFFGNNYGNSFPLSGMRREMVSMLKSQYRSFGVFGRGWNQSDGDFMRDPMGEAAIYRGAKIAINLSHFDYRRCSSSRLYKILGSGAFCLTKHYPEIEKDFEDGIHLVVWHDLEDLKEKIDYYLDSDYTRSTIAEQGHLLAQSKFTYKSMVQNIEQLYNQYK